MVKRCRTFHFFSQLPAELRTEIWNYCLPNRVCELGFLDRSTAVDLGYGDCKEPCKMEQTSEINRSPPALTRVCRESRSIALRAGKFVTLPRKDRPPARVRDSSKTQRVWQDSKRDMFHLNSRPLRDPDRYSYFDFEKSLSYAASHASQSSGCISFMEGVLGDYRPLQHGGPHSPRINKELITTAISRLSSCLVVMQVIFVHSHSNFRELAASGLFGVLGDAPVQIIDIADESRVNALHRLADTPAFKINVGKNQGFLKPQRRSAQDMKETLKRWARWAEEQSHCESLTAIMRPAIMFRRCTQCCSSHVCFGSDPEESRYQLQLWEQPNIHWFEGCWERHLRKR